MDKRNKGPGTTGAAFFEHSRPVPLNTSPVWGPCSQAAERGNPLSFYVWIKENCPTSNNELSAQSQARNPLDFLAIWQSGQQFLVLLRSPWTVCPSLWTLQGSSSLVNNSSKSLQVGLCFGDWNWWNEVIVPSVKEILCQKWRHTVKKKNRPLLLYNYSLSGEQTETKWKPNSWEVCHKSSQTTKNIPKNLR